MILRKVVVLFAVLSPLGLFAQGCQSGGVGDPCTPEDEYQSEFSGFSPKELNIESRSFQCETRVCLVNHFRGRVSCPLGQNENDAAAVKAWDDYSHGIGNMPTVPKPDHTAGTLCRLPGSSGSSAELVNVPVEPQCASRKAASSVYCSCRCDGPDPSAKYCDCPSGFVCQKFNEFDVGAAVSSSSAQLRGSYCIREKTVYTAGACDPGATVTETQAQADTCNTTGNCDGAKKNP